MEALTYISDSKAFFPMIRDGTAYQHLFSK